MPAYKRDYKSKATRKEVWRFVFKHRGRTFAKSGFTTREDAERAERDLRHRVEREDLRTLPSRKVTVADYMPKFIEHRRLVKAPNTSDREARRSVPVLRFFGRFRLADVRPGDVLDYVARRKEADGVGNRTVNLELTLLRSFFKFARMNGMVMSNPAKEVTNLAETHDEKWTPTREEFLRLVGAARSLRHAAYIEPWLWFRAYTGTRPAESFHVEWADVDFAGGQVHIRPKQGHRLKNGRFRVVSMHPELRPVLLQWRRVWERLYRMRKRRYPDSKDHDWVFIHPHNHDERGKGFLRTFDQARKAAGLPRMTSHTLRHYFISQCVMAGIPFFTIAKWVGHRNTRMIEETYGHLTPDYQAEQMLKLRITPVGAAGPGDSGFGKEGAPGACFGGFRNGGVCAANAPEVAGKVAGGGFAGKRLSS